ncbi:MAG TPA: lysophospholipid acyltransferase family protein [Clostridia bacterium]|nr:lysophospholipid acyltransferase family protein [Clostridia bacterium]
MANSVEVEAERKTKADEAFTLRQRIALWFISTIGYIAIRLIGATLRYECSSEQPSEIPDDGMPPARVIAPFWHRSVFPATYYFRDRGVSVMTSRSFDGEYIARIIESFGFRAVRGSSSRGAVRALLGMHTVIEAGGIAAFTIDGPRGPKYVAKPGPVLLARNTGAPILCFYVALSKTWQLNSWDDFMIPKPFSRAHIRWSAPIVVPREAGSEQMKLLHEEMQQALERVRHYAEEQVARAR